MPTFIHERMKFFFIHVPKTGGTSVTEFFFKNNRDPKRDVFSKLNVELGIHTGVSKVKKLLESDFDQYFSFAFYRNTWDWNYSLYRYIKRTASHPKHAEVKDLTFDQYVMDFMETFYRPQKPLVCLRNKSVITRLEPFENFAPTLKEILYELGYDQRSDIAVTNAATKKVDYRDMYTNETKDKTFRVYREDIEFFNFEF